MQSYSLQWTSSPKSWTSSPRSCFGAFGIRASELGMTEWDHFLGAVSHIGKTEGFGGWLRRI